jgi:Zn-dependent protease with chaperone function
VTSLPLRARLLVVGSVARASLIWAVPFVASATSPWIFATGIGFDLGWSLRALIAAVTVPPLLVAGLCVTFPHGRFGAWATRRITDSGARPSRRTVNLTEELGIATGSAERYEVLSVASPIPNVAALPGADHTAVVVTTGAEDALARDELEALIATQIVVASDRWVRLASAAQLVASPRFLLLFGAGFLNPVLVPLAFLAFMGHRRGDAVRDMVADSAALRATRHPEALSRSLFGLRPAAPHAGSLRVGLPAFLVDQYWVLSTRSTVTTTVSTPGSQRSWTTADEVAAEMTMRADRILRGSRGDLGALFDLRSWKRAVKGLGNHQVSPAGLPIPLTHDERARADAVGHALGATSVRGWGRPF